MDNSQLLGHLWYKGVNPYQTCLKCGARTWDSNPSPDKLIENALDPVDMISWSCEEIQSWNAMKEVHRQ